MHKRILLLIAVFMLIGCIKSTAMSTEDITVVSDRVTGNITISGNTDFTEYVTAYVTHENVTESELTASEFKNKAIAIGQSVSQNGEFEIVLKLARKYPSGTYKAFVATTTQSVFGKDFVYNSPYDIIDALEKFSSYTETDLVEFKNKVDEIKRLFELDTSVYESTAFDKDELAMAVISDRPAEGYKSVEEFNKMFYASVHTQILDDITNPDEYMTANKEEIGVDERYYTLSENARKDICSLISNADLKKPSQLYNIINENMMPAAFRNSENWNDYGEFADKFSDRMAISDEYKNMLAKINVQDVYKNMYLKKAEYTDDSKVIAEYKSQILSLYNAPKTSSPSIVSGGGSQGSSGMAVVSDNVSGNITADEKEKAFNDLDGYEWANEAIEYLKKQKIITGYPDGSFRPDANITREEFVKILVLAMELSPIYSDNTFSDVISGSWYEQTVKTAASLGIVNGIDKDIFGVGENITRQDLVTMVYRAALYQNINLKSGTNSITDFDEISEYAREAVLKLTRAGIINGVGNGVFAPKSFATRAETAKIIYMLKSYMNGGV